MFVVKFWQKEEGETALEEIVEVIRQMGMTDHLKISTVSLNLELPNISFSSFTGFLLMAD